MVLILGLAASGYWWISRPQVITLPGGNKMTLIGVTYGTHHVAPKIKINGKLTRGNGTQLNSTNDTLVVWVEAQFKANHYPNQFIVYDQANTACGVSTWPSTQLQINNTATIMGYMFNAYPRWDRSMIIHVIPGGPGGQRVAKELFVISNPKPVPVPKWTPESLPDTQSDGDLAVTLTKLVAGAQMPLPRGDVPQTDPFNKCVQLDFEFQQKGQSMTNWRPMRVVTSDATGNSLQSLINPYYQNGQSSGVFYEPGLWPDEPAWKLRVEFSRTSDFSDNEIWSVTNVPVHPGTQQDTQNIWNSNSGRSWPAFAEATINGIHLKLFPAIQYQDQIGGGGGGQSLSFSLKADPDPEAQAIGLTVVKANDDQGRDLQNRGSAWGGGSYQYQYANDRNVKSLNLSLAIHKNRFFEFTVKPEKP
jgi:hypothetical protein